MPQRVRDILVSLVCIVTGAVFLVGAFQYGNMRSIPNAGLLPMVGGAILILLSSVNLFFTIRENAIAKKERFFPHSFSLRRVLLILFAMIGYVVLLEYVGFCVDTLALMTFLLRFVEPQKWLTTVLAAVLTTAACYLIFVVFLQVQLPRDVLLKALVK